MSTIDVIRVAEATGAALVELARYHRGEVDGLDGLVTDLGDMDGATSTREWTKVQLNVLDSRLSRTGLRTNREHAAGMRLPPDLVGMDADGNLAVHLERETRGWEWNHIFGALIKLTFANTQPAPIAVLLLDCVRRRNGFQRWLDLLLEVSRRLLLAAPQVQRFYLAILGEDHSAGVLEVSRHTTGCDEVVLRWLLAISDQCISVAEQCDAADPAAGGGCVVH